MERWRLSVEQDSRMSRVCSYLPSIQQQQLLSSYWKIISQKSLVKYLGFSILFLDKNTLYFYLTALCHC